MWVGKLNENDFLINKWTSCFTLFTATITTPTQTQWNLIHKQQHRCFSLLFVCIGNVVLGRTHKIPRRFPTYPVRLTENLREKCTFQQKQITHTLMIQCGNKSFVKNLQCVRRVVKILILRQREKRPRRFFSWKKIFREFGCANSRPNEKNQFSLINQLNC